MIATLKYLRSKYLYIFLAIGLSVLAVYLIKRSEISFDFIGNISWYLMLLVFLCLILVIVYLYKKNSGDKKTSEKEIVSSLIEPYEKFYSLLASTLNKVGINSDRYIYAKPWYLFIGNNGAGKSSIINNSELTFERSEEVDLINRKIQASNGPVQFYLSSEAVIVERVEEENSDGNWPEFLKWLNNKKKGRPLNGLVVSIDIESLVNSSVNERKVLAKKVTDEVRSLNDLLGIRLPVYLVVTKVDLLEGFTEFYAEDSTEDFEDSLFCFTFPLAIDSKQGSDMDWAGTFSEQYGVLIDYLNESLQERIINEDISVEVYAFVRQMIGFKTILYSFLSEVFKESAHSTYPLLRCIFFTSSEQQSLPFNAVAESVSNLFGAPELVYLQRRGYSKNIFIKNIFLKKILPESGLVGDSFYVQKKQLRSHIVQYVICGLLVVLASSAWSYYYQSNKLSANNVLSGLESYSAIDKNRKITSPEDHLQGLNILREALDEYAIGGKKTGIFSDLGLYKGGLINPSVEKTYRKLISDGFFNSLITDMLSSKIQIGEKDSLEGFKTLRIVRLISESANQINLSANEIKLLKQYKQSIVIPRMEQRWQQRFSGDAKKQNELMKHLSYGLEHVGVELNLSQQVKLKKLQTTLANVSLPRRLYNQLRIESEYELGQGLSLRHEIGGSFDEIFSQNSRGNIKELDGATIPAFLTFNGFHEFYVPRYKALMSMVALDTWAMGRIENPKYFSDADIKRFQSLINDMYLDDYKKAWVNAASSINLIEFENDLGIAVKRLNSLAVSDSPYRSLLRTIKRNTILLTEKQPLVIKNTDDKDIDDPNIVSLKSALVTPQLKLDIVTPLKKYFHIYNDFLDSPEDRDSAYIDDIEAALTKLYDYMSDIQQNQVLGDNKGYALKKVMQRLELKSDDDPFYLVYRLASGLAQPMQGHLKKISSESWKILLRVASNDLNNLWQSDVYDIYSQKIHGRYPFSGNSQYEVSPDDFKGFFSSGGTAAVFHEKYLAPIMTHGGIGNESGMLVNKDVSRFFEHVKAIREGLFTSKGEYGVSFSIEPTDLSGSYLNSILNIDGVSISYHHAKTPLKDMIWPNQLGADGKSFARVTPISRGMNTEERLASGSWSLLRLLDMSKTIALGEKTREISFPFKAGLASYKLRVINEINPITRDLFSGFKVPKNISNTGFSKKSLNLL